MVSLALAALLRVFETGVVASKPWLSAAGRTLIWRLLPASWPKMAERRWRRLNGYSRGEGGRGLLRHRGSPTELVIDARADQVLGERHSARVGCLVGTAEDTRAGIYITYIRNSRTANRAQIDVEIFEFDADRVIEEVLDAGACRPAERRRWIVAKARGLRADPEVANGAAGGRVKEEVGPSVASTQSKGAQPINPGLASRTGRQYWRFSLRQCV